jgi:diketogulonate reductase-like aldo/keto reductase
VRSGEKGQTMIDRTTINRRGFIGILSAAAISALSGGRPLAQRAMPARPIPATGEVLPVIGLGSSKPVDMIASEGTEPIARVLRTLVAHGGSVVDTWPRNAQNDAGLGEVLSLPDLREALFVTSKIDRTGREAGLAQFRETQRLYRRETIDLVQIFSLTDLHAHWPTLRQLKDEGDARYIGVTVSSARLYEELERFIAEEQPDFIQVNYSISERAAEQRILPLAADSGIAIIINRPFMDGVYFDRLEGEPVPEWAAEFDCTSWAQFSLKYILANPHPTCVLTETTNPVHMAENATAALGRLPDAAARARMRSLIDELL